MILRNVQIRSFGAIQQRRIEFAPGLNIVVGKNEAGKSTLYSVIDHLLFTPVKMSKRDLEQRIGQWFPAAGGDTIAAELAGDVLDEEISISKQWGANPSCVLSRTPGGTYTDPSAVAQEIDTFWENGAGTIRDVCLLQQGRLSATIPAFRESADMNRSLTDMLQKAFIESDGLSISGFIETLSQRVNAYFSNWDRLRNAPAKGRGTQNKWVKGVGDVLQAYYHHGDLLALQKRAGGLFDEIAALHKNLISITEDLAVLTGFLEEYKSVYRTAGDRRALEAEYAGAAGKVAGLKQDLDDWKDTAKLRTEAEKAIQEKSEVLADLETQAALHGEAEEKWMKKKRFLELRDLQSRVDASCNYLKGLVAVSDKDYAVLKELRGLMRESEAQLKTGVLKASIQAKKNISFTFKPGLEGTEERDLLEGKVLEIESRGRITFGNEDLEITVSAGGDYEDIETRYTRGKEKFETLCLKLSVQSVEEAERVRGVYSEAAGEAGRLERELAAALAGDDYSVLEEEAEALGDVSQPEDFTELQKNQVRVQEQMKALEKNAEELRNKTSALQEKYESEDVILDTYGEIRGTQKKLESQLQALPAVPAEFSSAADFIAAYDEKLKISQELRQKLPRIEGEIALLEKDLPEMSLEELEENTNTAGRQLERKIAEGGTLERILEAALEIQKDIRENPYTGFLEKAESLLSVMTDNRYSGFLGSQETPIPGELETEGGEVLRYGQLSGGTKDVFSLAVRLAMAEYYLAGRKGFLLLDDPLVEMDPARQELAAAAVQDSARRYQCILFTCHPHFCDLFSEANIIRL